MHAEMMDPVYDSAFCLSVQTKLEMVVHISMRNMDTRCYVKMFSCCCFVPHQINMCTLVH